ncbi:LOW QUALITY PROTEIN: uncharacterized protein CXorf58 homolog [Mergus octosetaceus]
MVQDELWYQHTITDETIATVKDYIHEGNVFRYCIRGILFVYSNLDEIPAYFGGPNNCRRLSLQNFSRTVIHDIMDCAQPKTV